MFDIGWSELAIIAVVALIVIGPRDLPRVLYTAGKMAGKARGMLRELQQGIDDIGREAELEDMRKKSESGRDFPVTPPVRNTIDPTGEIAAAFDTAPDRRVDRPQPALPVAETDTASPPQGPAPLAPSSQEPDTSEPVPPYPDDPAPPVRG